MKRFLFELCAYLGEEGIERRSSWVSDEWLAHELAMDPNLDRLVDVPIGGSFPLPDDRNRGSASHFGTPHRCRPTPQRP